MGFSAINIAFLRNYFKDYDIMFYYLEYLKNNNLIYKDYISSDLIVGYKISCYSIEKVFYLGDFSDFTAIPLEFMIHPAPAINFSIFYFLSSKDRGPICPPPLHHVYALKGGKRQFRGMIRKIIPGLDQVLSNNVERSGNN